MNKTFRIFGFVGILSLGFAVTLVPPLLVSLWYDDGQVWIFLDALVLALVAGTVLWLPWRGRSFSLRRRDGFVVVALFWIELTLLSALPLILGAHLGPVDAIFEAASGLTTTGATVIQGLDDLPQSLLYYRQQLQWLGGMGLVVLAVAVMPLLGIGGMQIYRAETPGPMKDERLTPRLAQNARSLWMIYCGFTVACALAYWLAGMTPFDAIGHSFSTVSTGGFSTHDASIGYFESPLIEIIAAVFMLLGGINFSVHYAALHSRDLRQYLRDVEVRSFLTFVLLGTLVLVVVLRYTHEYDSFAETLLNSGFEVVSIITSTGFGAADFSHWPHFLPVLLIFISFIGGCGGSTAGGMKVMRVLLLIKQGVREVASLARPRSVQIVKIGNWVLKERTAEAIWGFFALYVVTFMLLTLALMATGLDQVSAFSAAATCLNNLGPGLGEVAYTFTSLSDPAKLLSMAGMLLGRLEIFTVLVLLTPAFWKE